MTRLIRTRRWIFASALKTWRFCALHRINDFLNDRTFIEGELKKHFEDAKRLSDFVGILTRLAFVAGFVVFCSHKASESKNYFETMQFNLCAGIGAAFGMLIAYRVANVLSHFVLRDVAAGRSWFYKVPIIVVGFFSYFSMIKGIIAVVYSTAAVLK